MTNQPEDTTDNDGPLLATRLREARTAIGLTQQDVANAVGIGRSGISDIESGTRRVYGLELCRLARLYRRPLGWFLGERALPIPDDLIAAVGGLSERDRAAVLAFSRFLAHQAVTR